MFRPGTRPGWPPGFIDGVGWVPGGPRVVQLASGSVAVVAPDALTPATSTEPVIKAEPIEDINMLHESVEVISAVPNLPEEEYLGPTDTEDVYEFGTAYQNDLIHLLSVHNQQSRNSRNRSSYYSRDSEGEAAARQKIDPSIRIRSRDRSRSPVRHSYSDNSSRSTSASGSLMFFPENERSGASSSTGILSRESTPVSNVSSSGSSDISIKRESVERCQRCKCPISYECTARTTQQVDCRCMVREWKNWSYRSDQEAFDRERAARPFGERFTTIQTIVDIVRVINNFENAPNAPGRRTAMTEMKRWILDMEDVTVQAGPQQVAVTQQVLPRIRQFLDPNNQQVRQSSGLPDFIEEELTVLRNKWGRGDFSGSITRGLDERITYDINGIPLRMVYLVDPVWQIQYGGDAKDFGDNGLVNGQIWLKRVHMMRDGAHAAPIAGISGNPSVGAYSVVLGEFDERTNKGYANIDMGNVIEYLGTALPDNGDGPTNVVDPHLYNPNSWTTSMDCANATSATQALYRSQLTGEPVRVIRSWKMCEAVTNKPRRGYRYDGLYRVVKRTALKEARQIWSFRLERLPGQGQLRGFEPHNTYPDSRGRRYGRHFSR